MKQKFLPITCLITSLMFAGYAVAVSVPNAHLQSESKAEDAILVTPDNKFNINQNSQFDVFVDTLLGKNIDKLPEKPMQE